MCSLFICTCKTNILLVDSIKQLNSGIWMHPNTSELISPASLRGTALTLFNKGMIKGSTNNDDAEVNSLSFVRKVQNIYW